MLAGTALCVFLVLFISSVLNIYHSPNQTENEYDSHALVNHGKYRDFSFC